MGANVAREDGIVKGGETAGAVLWGWGGVFPHPSSASAEVSPLPVVEGKTARSLPPPGEGKPRSTRQWLRAAEQG